MKIEFKSKNSRSNLIASIVFLIIGALMLANPNQVVAFIAYICGICLIFFGLYAAFKNYFDTKHDSNTPSTDLIYGIISIVIGVIFFFLANIFGKILQYVFGAWMLFMGISKLISALQVERNKRNDKNFKIQLIIAIILIGAGLFTILISNLALQLIGVFMIIYAILEIVGTLVSKKEGNDSVVTIIKDENIKDAKVIDIPEKEEEQEVKKITKKKTTKKAKSNK